MMHPKLTKKTKKKPITYWKNKADKLMRELVYKRKDCERCGRSAGVQLQDAHVVTRSNLHLRYNAKNHLLLCATCHMYWHREPLSAVTWFQYVYKDRFEYLMKEKEQIEHTLDYEAVIERLKNETSL